MLRIALRALLVCGLIGIGWTVGRAQSAQAPVQPDFEITVTAPVGDAQLTCVRGCSITWAPTVFPASGPVDIHVPTASVKGSVTAAQGCMAPDYSKQNCKIWGWIKR